MTCLFVFLLLFASIFIESPFVNMNARTYEQAFSGGPVFFFLSLATPTHFGVVVTGAGVEAGTVRGQK